VGVRSRGGPDKVRAVAQLFSRLAVKVLLVGKRISFGLMDCFVAVFGRRIECLELQFCGVRIVYNIVFSSRRNSHSVAV
jgi:hypothetical protein